ncbi:MAG: hypothetical protein AAF740_01785, partial [Bacteroidota bacterium]
MAVVLVDYTYTSKFVNAPVQSNTELIAAQDEIGDLVLMYQSDREVLNATVRLWLGDFVFQNEPIPSVNNFEVNVGASVISTPRTMTGRQVSVREKNGTLTFQQTSKTTFTITISDYIFTADLKAWLQNAIGFSNEFRMLTSSITDNQLLGADGNSVYYNSEKRLGLSVEVDYGSIANQGLTDFGISLQNRDLRQTEGHGAGEYAKLIPQSYIDNNPKVAVLVYYTSNTPIKVSVRTTTTADPFAWRTPGQFTEIRHTTATGDFLSADPNIPYPEYPNSPNFVSDPTYFIGAGAREVPRSLFDAQNFLGADWNLDAIGLPVYDPSGENAAFEPTNRSTGVPRYPAKQALWFETDPAKFYWVVWTESSSGNRANAGWWVVGDNNSLSIEPKERTTDYLPVSLTPLNSGVFTPVSAQTSFKLTASEIDLVFAILTPTSPIESAYVWLIRRNPYSDAQGFVLDLNLQDNAAPQIQNLGGNTIISWTGSLPTGISSGETYIAAVGILTQNGNRGFYLSEPATVSAQEQLLLTPTFSSFPYQDSGAFSEHIRISPLNRVKLRVSISNSQAQAVQVARFTLPNGDEFLAVNTAGNWGVSPPFSGIKNVPYLEVNVGTTNTVFDFVIRVLNEWANTTQEVSVLFEVPTALENEQGGLFRLVVEPYENDRTSPVILESVQLLDSGSNPLENLCAATDSLTVETRKITGSIGQKQIAVHTSLGGEYIEAEEFAVPELPQLTEPEITRVDEDFAGDLAIQEFTKAHAEIIQRVTTISQPSGFSVQILQTGDGLSGVASVPTDANILSSTYTTDDLFFGDTIGGVEGSQTINVDLLTSSPDYLYAVVQGITVKDESGNVIATPSFNVSQVPGDFGRPANFSFTVNVQQNVVIEVNFDYCLLVSINRISTLNCELRVAGVNNLASTVQQY